MATNINQRCYNHHLREAVARCPGCGHFFCRECITEHDEKMLCSSCLAQSAHRRSGFGKSWAHAGVLFMQAMAGWLMLGYAFYLIGKLLLSIPHDFHEGTFWQNG